MNDLIIFIWIVLLLFDSVFHVEIQKLKISSRIPVF